MHGYDCPLLLDPGYKLAVSTKSTNKQILKRVVIRETGFETFEFLKNMIELVDYKVIREIKFCVGTCTLYKSV